MIVLDTNVLSALMRANLEPAVTAWLNTQLPSSVWTTTVSLFEIQFGLNTMPTGKNQRALKQAFADVVQQDLNNRILGFDAGAAQQAAEIASKLQAIGRRGEIRDLMIAGVVAAQKASRPTYWRSSHDRRDDDGPGIDMHSPADVGWNGIQYRRARSELTICRKTLS